eukprot:TRINITY_DN3904_c3_g1_i1.p1 TRINITY_DN3904_c3_g1~~TRINITY_DN3904_c3_g1_i1.p1  ORF type:complete len:1199 (+),score=300.21 TRINITY_DN3904_c3_g1_i1:105-3701(+)
MGRVPADMRSVRSAGSKRSKRSGASQSSGGSGQHTRGQLATLRLQYDEEQRRLRALTAAVEEFQEEIQRLQTDFVSETTQAVELEESLQQQLEAEEAALQSLQFTSQTKRATLATQRRQIEETRTRYFMSCVQFAYNFVPTRTVDLSEAEEVRKELEQLAASAVVRAEQRQRPSAEPPTRVPHMEALRAEIAQCRAEIHDLEVQLEKEQEARRAQQTGPRWIRAQVQQLRKLPLFAAVGGDPEFLGQLARSLTTRAYSQGELVGAAGAVDNCMFVVAEGVLEVRPRAQGGAVPSHRLTAGEFHGDVSLIYDVRRTESIAAGGPAQVHILSSRDLAAAMQQHPKHNSGILSVGSKRFRDTALGELLGTVPLFAHCSEHRGFLGALVSSMRREDIAEGRRLSVLGETGSDMYFLARGHLLVVDAIADGEVLLVMRPGDFFGELALLYDIPRAATVEAGSDSELWALGKDDFEAVCERFPAAAECMQVTGTSSRLSDQQLQELVARAPFFASVRSDAAFMKQVAARVRSRAFDAGAMVVKQGDPGAELFIVQQGRLRLRHAQGALQELREGMSFGDPAVMLEVQCTATVVAATRCEVLSLPRAALRSVLDSHPEHVEKLKEAAEKRQAKVPIPADGPTVGDSPVAPSEQSLRVVGRLFERCPLFALCQGDSRFTGALCGALVARQYPEGSVIVSAGQAATGLFILNEGLLDVVADGDAVCSMWDAGLFFGELSLHYQTAYSTAITAGAASSVFYADRAALLEVLREFPEQAAGIEGAALASFRDFALRDLLAGVPLFEGAAADSKGRSFLSALEPLLTRMSYGPGELVTERGTSGTDMYLVGRGECEALSGESGDEVMLLRPGSLFGEQAFLPDCPYTATVCPTGHGAQLFRLRRADLQRLFTRYPQQESATARVAARRLRGFVAADVLRGVPLLAAGAEDPRLLTAVATQLEPREVDAGEVITREREAACPMYCIAFGQVVVSAQGQEPLTLKEGQFFGDTTLLSEGPSPVAVTAATRAELFALSKDGLCQAAQGCPGMGDTLRLNVNIDGDQDRSGGQTPTRPDTPSKEEAGAIAQALRRSPSQLALRRAPSNLGLRQSSSRASDLEAGLGSRQQSSRSSQGTGSPYRMEDGRNTPTFAGRRPNKLPASRTSSKPRPGTGTRTARHTPQPPESSKKRPKRPQSGGSPLEPRQTSSQSIR